jgi:hypothetical protein
MTTREKILIDALRTIAAYPLPSFGDADRPMVPLHNADYLRTLAKDALQEAKVKAHA